jgi:hypothetical protein
MAIGSKPVQNFLFQNADSGAFAEGWEGLRDPGLELNKRITCDAVFHID